ncbi:MAG: methyltransferase domain-containing protein [Acidobacteriota bacterium]
MSSPWDPQQYERFNTQRSQPFFDLLDMVEPDADLRVVDLGCGTGELTQALHRKLEAGRTLGVDSSASMLEESAKFRLPTLGFEQGDLATFSSDEPFGLVFSNAAFQWVGEHERLLEHVASLVADGGQLAFQVPNNHDDIQHVLAHRLAREEPFASALTAEPQEPQVLPAQDYARLLHRLGFREQRVFVRVYPHLLESRESVVEWIKGTALNAYKKVMPAERYEEFLGAYREQLLPELPDDRPFFFPFRRILAWGRR